MKSEVLVDISESGMYNLASYNLIVREKIKMAVCELTGKGKQHGNNVSFSLRRTKRVFKPNIQKKTVVVNGKKAQLNLSTQAIRTLKKKGLL